MDNKIIVGKKTVSVVEDGKRRMFNFGNGPNDALKCVLLSILNSTSEFRITAILKSEIGERLLNSVGFGIFFEDENPEPDDETPTQKIQVDKDVEVLEQGDLVKNLNPRDEDAFDPKEILHLAGKMPIINGQQYNLVEGDPEKGDCLKVKVEPIDEK